MPSGGIITPGTVGEQMLYEIGDPQNYILPDVVVDFSQVQVCGGTPFLLHPHCSESGMIFSGSGEEFTNVIKAY